MSSIDEGKIKKLNRINTNVNIAKNICDELEKYSGNNKYTVRINIYYKPYDSSVYESINGVDVRAILASLLIQKEELENEIKGEIKNER